MESKTPSKIGNLRELIAQLSLSVQVQKETADILEDISAAVYSLDQDRKRLLADYKALDGRCASLEQRYSDILYKFSEAVKASKN